jgi:membrane glycosyltransferase
LSHDFVEAALMGRAGQEVWLALDLAGSYEESPPNLLDELKRDRRWCQGNLQHLRVLFADGVKTGHRAILAMGVMAYASALFWAAFLILNTIQLATQSLTSPDYFSSEPSLFPVWPRWNPEWAIALASTTALLLFLPKLLSFIWIVERGAANQFGGPARLGMSIVLEIILSTLLAPLRMWFHSKFVLLTLFGRTIKWNAQQRAASGTSWSEALRAHGVATLFAGGWIAAVSWLNAAMFVWLLPVAIPLLLSIALSVYSSRVAVGDASRRQRLFEIPEEENPPPVIAELQGLLHERMCRVSSPSVLPAEACDLAVNSAQRAAHPPAVHAALAE